MKKSKVFPHPLIKNPHLDGDLFYLQGNRVGVLLVHGFTASTAEMRPLAEYLHNKGYTVSGPLLPGHNTYPEDINNYTWKDWVATVESAYQELAKDCEQIFIGGESTGGVLALYLATYHPEIAGILTYAPALKLNFRIADLILLYVLAPFVPYIQTEDSDDGLAWRGYQARPLKGVIQLLRLQRKTKIKLATIRKPVLIVQGRLDTTVHPDVPEMISDSVSSDIIEINWMNESAHCVALDRELDRVNGITSNFIEKVLGSNHGNRTS
jgi:carboxylesterase